MINVSNASTESQVLDDFLITHDVKNKKILEVGGVIDEGLIKDLEVHWVSVDPLYTPLSNYELISTNRELKKIHHIMDDITQPLFENEEFDYIFSCNAFQHITDLKQAFCNFYRWLKVGGVLYAHFGPIWSAPDGCHIEALEHQGNIYNFWQFKLIPYWSHLYFSQDEMLCFLKKHYSFDFSQKIAHMIYKSNWINRYTYQDYKNLLNEDQWEINIFSSSSAVDYFPVNSLKGSDRFYEKKFLSSLTKHNYKDYASRDLLIVIKKR